MALAAALSLRIRHSPYFSTDLCLGFGEVSRCCKKSVASDGRILEVENGPKGGRRLHAEGAGAAVSLRQHGRNAGPWRRWRSNAPRCELGSNLGDTAVEGEAANPKTGVSLGSDDALLGKDDLSAADAGNQLRHEKGEDAIGGCSGGSGGNGEFPPGGGGAGNGGDGNDGHGPDDEGDEEGTSVLKFEEVMKEAEARGVNLPPDMYEAAKTVGIQKVLFENYLNLQELAWPLGAAIRWCPLLRDRMLVDRRFLFKIGAEIVIDSCCATVAEVQKRGNDFWAEFELYAADLLVGVVVNVALVGLLAPYARIGQLSSSKGLFNSMARYCDALPSSVFEAERPGYRFSAQQRIGTYFIKGVLYASVGFVCGLVGQGIANMIMTAKRTVNKSEDDVPVPPLVKSAALWGVFLAVSSNTRYQIINGLERVVESTAVARRAPPVAMAFTVGVRLANNIYGGMQFVDWARLSGCQ